MIFDKVLGLAACDIDAGQRDEMSGSDVDVLADDLRMGREGGSFTVEAHLFPLRGVSGKSAVSILRLVVQVPGRERIRLCHRRRSETITTCISLASFTVPWIVSARKKGSLGADFPRTM